ncbi:MAG: hypothetical protein GKR87_09380 [Kiritimatiellae bacterium]|nr:hypothetical protein [Kiritimatiellia bacterium]
MDAYQVGSLDLIDDELFEVFASEAELKAESLNSAMVSRNLNQIAEDAHSIRGIGGAMGFPEISVLAEKLELASKEAGLDRCVELVQTFGSWNINLSRINGRQVNLDPAVKHGSSVRMLWRQKVKKNVGIPTGCVEVFFGVPFSLNDSCKKPRLTARSRVKIKEAWGLL